MELNSLIVFRLTTRQRSSDYIEPSRGYWKLPSHFSVLVEARLCSGMTLIYIF